MLNHPTTTRNYEVTYYKTLEEVSWQLGLEERKNWQKFSKGLRKNVKISIKLRVFSDRLFVSSHGGGGGGGGNSALGVGTIVGGNSGDVFNF